MMKQRFLKTMKRFILLSAISHLAVLAIIAWHSGISALNYFAILDLDFFFPAIGQGFASQIIAVIVMVTIFLLLFFLSKDSDQIN